LPDDVMEAETIEELKKRLV